MNAASHRDRALLLVMSFRMMPHAAVLWQVTARRQSANNSFARRHQSRTVLASKRLGRARQPIKPCSRRCAHASVRACVSLRCCVCDPRSWRDSAGVVAQCHALRRRARLPPVAHPTPADRRPPNPQVHTELEGTEWARSTRYNAAKGLESSASLVPRPAATPQIEHPKHARPRGASSRCPLPLPHCSAHVACRRTQSHSQHAASGAKFGGMTGMDEKVDLRATGLASHSAAGGGRCSDYRRLPAIALQTRSYQDLVFPPHRQSARLNSSPSPPRGPSLAVEAVLEEKNTLIEMLEQQVNGPRQGAVVCAVCASPKR